jgi:hypothetical protein
MHKNLILLAAAAMVGVAVPLTAQQAPGADLTAFGYPDVLATVDLWPGQSTYITVPDQVRNEDVIEERSVGLMTIRIPADAFTHPVRFEVLSNRDAAWNSQVPAGQTVVANFAYRVTDLITNMPVLQFAAPLDFYVYDSQITQSSVYWATTASNPIRVVNANQGSVIRGDFLEHATPVASVGWIITSPASEAVASAPGGSSAQ